MSAEATRNSQIIRLLIILPRGQPSLCFSFFSLRLVLVCKLGVRFASLISTLLKPREYPPFLYYVIIYF
jgi:hypothetical protein